VAEPDAAPEPIRVLVIADTRLYREGLTQVLGRTGSLVVTAAVTDAHEAAPVIEREAVDVVLLGLTAAESVHAARALTAAHGALRVVALAVDDRPEEVVPLAEVGICGYVPRDAALADLVRTLRSVVRGESPCSPAVAAGLLRRLAALAGNGHSPEATRALTVREQEVLALMGEGLSNKQIAQRLCIEVPTVKNHVHHVFEKLEVHRRTEAIAVVRRGSWA
jgi:two-component system, NarL family, nitrate/nitrite response regulator NarL